ncbi:MAG: hypothetical protein JF613_07860, partial [Acidobacteria bacterium]|nr:hypothetical protein [Acidobacteriota bacterium]
MAVTRRRFVQAAGLGAGTIAADWIGARGRENALWSLVSPTLQASERDLIVLSSNENPVGPGLGVLNAIRTALGEGGRSAGRYSTSTRDLVDAIARKQGV